MPSGPVIDHARHLRQILLPEIGERGQERIARARASVAGASLAHEVATLYARGAGFAELAAGDVDVDDLAPPDIARNDAPRQVLAGARAALREIRRAVESGEEPG